jgi:parallel beta-helix repeat protein
MKHWIQSATLILLLTTYGYSQADTDLLKVHCVNLSNADCDLHSTVEEAIAHAEDGETLLLGPGRYGVLELNRSITVLGANHGRDARAREFNAASESIVKELRLHADNIVIDGFTIEGSDQSGLTLSSAASGYRILNNIVQNNVFGIYLHSSGDQKTVVSQNLFRENNLAGSASGDAIYSDQGMKNVLIDNNLFTGHKSATMVLAGGSQSRVDFTNNEIISDKAVVLFNTDDVNVSGNRMRQASEAGLFLGGGNSRVLVSQNSLAGSGASAIEIADPGRFKLTGLPNRDVEVKGNSLSGNDLGIAIQPNSVQGFRANLNSFTGNTRFGLSNHSQLSVDANCNYWGSETGPLTTENPRGTGDRVGGRVIAEKYLVSPEQSPDCLR